MKEGKKKVWIFRETGEVRKVFLNEWYVYDKRPVRWDCLLKSAGEHPILSLSNFRDKSEDEIDAFTNAAWLAIKKAVGGKE